MIHNCLHPCTVCKKYGHDTTGFWINTENNLKAALDEAAGGGSGSAAAAAAEGAAAEEEAAAA